MPLELKPLWLLLKHNILSKGVKNGRLSQTWLVMPIDFDIYSWNANNVTFPWQIPSRVQKFNIIIVKSEITFWISIAIFVCLFVFFQCILSIWCAAKFLGARRRCPPGVTFIRARKVVLCLSCLHSIQGEIELPLQKFRCSPEIFHWN